MTGVLGRSTRLAALAAGLGLLAVTAPADATTYTVYSCRGPDGTPVSTRAWQADDGDAGVADECPAGGSLSAQVDLDFREKQDLSGLRFMVPPGTVIAGYRVHLTAITGGTPGLQAGLAEGSLVGSPQVTAGCPDAACSFGNPDDPLADDNLVTSERLPNPALALLARCGWVFGCFGEGITQGQGVAAAQLWRSAVDLLDEQPPQLGAPTGPLLGPGAVAGRAAIGAPATDDGGGVAAVALRIDGTEVARTLAGGSCVKPFDVAQPCPATLPASFEVDTRGLPDGPHVAELQATDAVGQSTSSGPLAFSSANAGTGSGGGGSGGGAGSGGATAPASGEPVAVRVDLARTRFTLPAPGGRIKGVVRRADGTPAAGVQLEIRSARFGTGDPKYRTERTLRTDASGGFAAPVGTSARRLLVLVDDAGYRSAESDEVQIIGRLRIALEARGRDLRNGSRLTLAAAISGAGSGAAKNRTVLVQAMVRGHWTTVDSVEADAHGGARWRYRFRGTTRSARYRFRVRVPRGAADWPWPATTSAVVVVNVRP